MTDHEQDHTFPENTNTGSGSSGKASSLRQRVAKELAVERMMQQMSQQELADALNTQKSSISRIENGHQNLTVDYIELIAKQLNKQVSFVMERPAVQYGDNTEYSLRLYDEELLRFRMSRSLGLTVKILWIKEERKHLLPLELELTDEGLLAWLRNRIIPQNRELVGTILDALNLDINDTKGIIDICMGLSLNDSYWVTQKGFPGLFAEYNLYQNQFDEALSIIAYVGHGNSIQQFHTSPELTTGGMLRKAWRFSKQKGIWLYKSGTSGFANAGNEPYSEFYACQVAERMGIPCVHYELENWHHILASKCRLFTDIQTSYIPIGRIVTHGGIQACLDYYKSLGDSFYQELASMLVFDAVIINEDRHFGNFGLLRDNLSGKILSPAPVFDNGISLLCLGMKEDFGDNLDGYVKSRTNPYGKDFQYYDLCRQVIGPIQKKQLRRLIGFTFTESDLCNLPGWRLRALENLIQKRVRDLLLL